MSEFFLGGDLMQPVCLVKLALTLFTIVLVQGGVSFASPIAIEHKAAFLGSGLSVSSLSGHKQGIQATKEPIKGPGAELIPTPIVRQLKTKVLAWAPLQSGTSEIIQPWYQLREWSSLVSGEVCGQERFQREIKSRAREAKQATDAMPKGKKGILVFWELAPHWDDPRDFVRDSAGTVQGWVDDNGRFHPYLSPWWDAAALESRCRIESFFGEFKRLGGSVDYILLDTERTMSNWQLDNFAAERYGAMRSMVGLEVAEQRRIAYYQAIERDPRMDLPDRADLGFQNSLPLRPQLTTGSLSRDVAKWWYPEVKNGINRFAYLQWNQLMGDRAATYINFAVSEPVLQLYPNALITDYGRHFFDSKYNVPDAHGHRVSMFPAQVIVGNRQSRQMYGWLPDLSYYYVKSPFLRYQGTPFNALRQNLNWLRSGILARPDVPFQPWIAPKSFGTRSDLDGCRECRFAGNSMYEEMIFHTLLSTPEALLFWNPSGVSSKADEAALLAAITEYERTIGYSTLRSPQIQGIIDWEADFVLSSQITDLSTVYRFTPNLGPGQTIEGLVRSRAPAILNTPSGAQLRFGAGSRLMIEPGSAGLWIVGPKASPRATK